MDQERLAAELVGHLRRDVVDVGVVLALDARRWPARLRRRTSAPGSALSTTALTPLPPVMQIDVAVLQRLQQQARGSRADLLQDGLRD